MSKSRETIAKLLAAFADALNSMDDREFDMLIHGKAKLRIIEERTPALTTSLDNSYLEQVVSELAQQLSNAESREAAGDLIASINQPRRKDFLLLLAKACDVNVGPKDSIQRIEQNLIENVVGAKLRSQAIRNVAF